MNEIPLGIGPREQSIPASSGPPATPYEETGAPPGRRRAARPRRVPVRRARPPERPAPPRGTVGREDDPGPSAGLRHHRRGVRGTSRGPRPRCGSPGRPVRPTPQRRSRVHRDPDRRWSRLRLRGAGQLRIRQTARGPRGGDARDRRRTQGGVTCPGRHATEAPETPCRRPGSVDMRPRPRGAVAPGNTSRRPRSAPTGVPGALCTPSECRRSSFEHRESTG